MKNQPSARIAFVQSCWHEELVDRAREGFLSRLTELGLAAGQVDCYRVPGAFEIPLKCKQLLTCGGYAMAVAAGFVVDGGIYRHEFVAQAVISGLMQVQLELGLPVLSVVLTPQQFQEMSDPDREFFFEHMYVKGKEAAEVAEELLQSQVPSPKSQVGSWNPA